MKKPISLLIGLLLAINVFAQIKIHSHNDYEQLNPFSLALEHRVDQVEADVFLVKGKLLVAHSRSKLDSNRTLSALYLQPIADSFKQNGNRISSDRDYRISLMIDIKDNWDLVYPVLKNEIERYGSIFNRNKNSKAVQLVISGNRPNTEHFYNYPKWLIFDGLSGVNYTTKNLKRVAFISDNFAKYSKWKGKGELSAEDLTKLEKPILEAKQKNRPFRYWGAPDTEEAWKVLESIGATIINTDRIKACTTYFKTK